MFSSFLPIDNDSRDAGLLCLGCAGVALADANLRRADAFEDRVPCWSLADLDREDGMVGRNGDELLL